MKKILSLLGILAVGGIGYYLLKNKKNNTSPELTSTGQPLFQPPVNNTWVNPPASSDSKGNTDGEFLYTTQQSVDINPDIGLLIKNPSIKSKNNYYIDQFGNLIQAPTKAFPDGVLVETAKRIADWRKANGVII